MPKSLERKLRREARRKYPGNKDRQDAYVYGTMNKLGLLKPEEKGGDKKK
jgi:hypothetical protein